MRSFRAFTWKHGLLAAGLLLMACNDDPTDDDDSTTRPPESPPIEASDTQQPASSPTPVPDLDGDGYTAVADDCNTEWYVSGADYVENLSDEQAKIFGVILRAWDNNCSCFPGRNENAAISFTLQDCCWTNGIGNCTACYAAWQAADHSQLKLANILPGTCTAGNYPCNDLGYRNAGASCYDTSCKVFRVEVWGR